MTKLTFKPKQVSKKLLATLPSRARDILINRFGLGDSTESMTLEKIGKNYKITRERIRQIENYALNNIRKSDVFEKEKATFDELVRIIDDLGGVVEEEELLAELASDKSTKNHLHLLLVLGNLFSKRKETEEFRHRWSVDDELADQIQDSLKKLYESLTDDDLIPESEFISRFLEHVQTLNNKYKNEEIVRRWLSLSKSIGKNPLGEWGRATSSNVRAKGMRDYAYLAIKRHGSPMHFREVAKSITELFNRKAHEATCHNELIKDKRFVLVGRGLYALAEWGYSEGIVRDVIQDILKKDGPLSREEVIDRVRKERYVKDNTILVNLQDSSTFKRDETGQYTLV